MPDDLQTELLKRSWANPANRPPRDTWRPPTPDPVDIVNARLHQRDAVEDSLGVPQPYGPEGGLPINPDGSLGVYTRENSPVPYSPEFEAQQKVLRYVLAHQAQFPNGQPDVQDVLDALDEADPQDLIDNSDQDPEEMIQRVRAADAIARQNREQ